MQNQSPKASKRAPGRPKRAQRRPRDVQKAPKSVKEGSRRRKCRFSRVLQLKMGAQRHPRGVQGVQNDPRGMPEASKRRPRVSKKRPGGAKLDLLVFYNVFKRPQSLGGMRGGALITYRLGRLTELNNIQTSTSLHILENQPWSYTHWRAGGHGADLKAKASCRRPPK